MQHSNGIFTLHKKRDEKHGSLVISTLAFSASGHGFDPRGRQGKISAFRSVICRDDTK